MNIPGGAIPPGGIRGGIPGGIPGGIWNPGGAIPGGIPGGILNGGLGGGPLGGGPDAGDLGGIRPKDLKISKYYHKIVVFTWTGLYYRRWSTELRYHGWRWKFIGTFPLDFKLESK